MTSLTPSLSKSPTVRGAEGEQGRECSARRFPLTRSNNTNSEKPVRAATFCTEHYKLPHVACKTIFKRSKLSPLASNIQVLKKLSFYEFVFIWITTIFYSYSQEEQIVSLGITDVIFLKKKNILHCIYCISNKCNRVCLPVDRTLV